MSWIFFAAAADYPPDSDCFLASSLPTDSPERWIGMQMQLQRMSRILASSRFRVMLMKSLTKQQCGMTSRADLIDGEEI